MWNPNAPGAGQPQQQQQQPVDERRQKHDPAGECPECGADLSSFEPNRRYKHALYHWGEAPLDNYPSTLEARRRKAQVLGTSIEAVTK